MDHTIINIEEEMKGAYLDYAMSVIVGRALPDFRDGLKPVHRRALYAMHELNNYHDKPYKKSARVVGDVIGKYHPHGDTAVYDTIVRMAQDFSMRYMLVDGQGNFGSVDGDSPAAMRYTEIRLAKVSDDFLNDLDKETVEFAPNYDGTLTEPKLLPTKIPNYLVNGTSGIAVGMATSVPPHNLSEVIKGLFAVIDNPDVTIQELMQIIPGPDFPTRGLIYGVNGIAEAYSTGKGIIRMRARAEVEETKKGGERVIVTEIPYQVNKARLIEKIAELVRDKKIEGISDIKDESSRVGIRVVVDVKRGFQGSVVLNQLYKYTAMQSTFGITMLGIENNQPKVLTLKQYLGLFLDFRREVVTKRTVYLLKKAEERAHILLGLKMAVENIDAVVALIKAAPNPNDAKLGLMKKFSLSEIQSQAILELRLQRLTGLERDKIIAEYQEILSKVTELKSILNDDKKITGIIRTELLEMDQMYGDVRKTEIVGSAIDFEDEDLITQEDVVVITTSSGYVKRMSIEMFREQRRGGKGVKGQALKEDDIVANAFAGSTHDYILCFSDKGKCYWLKIYQIPSAAKDAKGKHIANLLNLQEGEKIVAMLPVKEFTESKNIIMISEKGVIKKTSLMNFSRPKSSGIIAVSTDEGDVIEAVHLVSEGNHILVGTKQGMSICFNEADVSQVGRTARGVRGVRLTDGDKVVGMEVIADLNDPKHTIMTVFDNGYGKRTEISEFRIQSRGGKGVIAGKTGEKVGLISTLLMVKEDDGLMLVSDGGQTIRINVKDISVIGRNTQGVRIMNLSNKEKIVGVAKIINDDTKIEKIDE
ncbi:MAG: DNA gyrase subunit A [Pseudomonadota bacterium]